MTSLKENTSPLAQQSGEDTPQDKQQDISLKPEILMSWTTKAIPFSPKEIMKTQLGLLLMATLANVFITWSMWGNLPDQVFDLFVLCFVGYGLVFYFIMLGVRQKTLFNYSITRDNGYIEYHPYFSNGAKIFFKGIAIAAFLLFIGAAIYTQSLLFLIGPGAIALGAAKFILGWKNEIKQEQSLPWNEYNFVTVDRKRLIIVALKSELPFGFKARFQNKELFEQYLALLHRLLPVTAAFTEAHWEY
ncbi:permease [Pseudomonas sp. GW456-L15]|uniref:permease n=1 Tax=Pseudomonas sp. GW456-L15 TaxID=2751353 RepID=UPI001A90FEC8|nr:permease [Pseudomonas sp. GW456-L15]